MKKIVQMAVIPVLMAALSPNPVQAANFIENNDAGELVSTAQSFPGASQSINTIAGVLSSDADLYRIFIPTVENFAATTISAETFQDPLPADLLPDPQLFLFDSNGLGICANDNLFGPLEATLPEGRCSLVEPGFYYLGISSFDYDPISSNGDIFPGRGVPSEAVVGPTGTGGDSPLIGFTGTSQFSGRYTISLFGTQTGPQSVPEHDSILGLLLLGALGATSQLRNKKVKQV